MNMVFRCNRCSKPMKQIDEHTWKLDCECIEEYPELKKLRFSIGSEIEKENPYKSCKLNEEQKIIVNLLMESPMFGFEFHKYGIHLSTEKFIQLKECGVNIRRTKFAPLSRGITLPKNRDFKFKASPKTFLNSSLYYLEENKDIMKKMIDMTDGYAFTKAKFLSKISS